jgi:hypothetical protein
MAATKRELDKDLMAKALAEYVLNFKDEVDRLLYTQGVDSSTFSPMERLVYVERFINTNPSFAEKVVNNIGKIGGKPRNLQFRNFVDAIINAVGGVTSGISAIIDATNPTSQEAKKTAAQAALVQAQANLEAQRAKAAGTNAIIYVGLAIAGALVIGGGIFAYFKFKNK